MNPKRWYVRVYCLFASYVAGPIYVDSKEEAIQDVRDRVMRDMKHWSFSAWIE